MTLTINASFDGGNIRVVGVEGDRSTWRSSRTRISDFYQWFYFRSGREGPDTDLPHPERSGFGLSRWLAELSGPCLDRPAEWRMTPTVTDGVLEWQWTGESDLAWFAYFEPYTMERHHDLVARIAAKGVYHEEIGQTLDGQPIDYFRLGSGPKQVWLYARQHPGESMAEWWMEARSTG